MDLRVIWKQHRRARKWIVLGLTLWWGSAVLYGVYTVVVYGDEILEMNQ